MLVEVRLEARGARERVAAGEVEAEEGAQAQPGDVEVAREHHQLDAVAGGEQHGLVDFLARDELAQQRNRIVDGEPLAQRERRRAVAHADQQDLHANSSTPITAKKRKPKAKTAAVAAWRAPWRPPKRSAASTA